MKIPVQNGILMQENGVPEVPHETQRLSGLFSQKFCVSSWNVQGGLQDGFAFDRIIGDLTKRKVQIGCLQETHCAEGVVVERGAGKVICLEDSSDTPTAQRYGLGFFIASSLVDHYRDHRYVSNRIAVLRLNAPYGGARRHTRKSSTICIINVYAPTSQRAVKYPREHERFFEQLTATVEEAKRNSVIVFVCGDYNAKLGLRESDEDGVKEAFMGNFGKGTRNRSGGYLAQFLKEQGMYAANTHFRHSMRHRTTWHGRIANSTRQMLDIRNQIDYVMVSQCFKEGIVQARSYHGHEFSSDHGMVVATFDLNIIYRVRKRRLCRAVNGVEMSDSIADNARPGAVVKQAKTLGQRVTISELTMSTSTRDKYQEKLAGELARHSSSGSQDAVARINACIETAATAELPRLVRTKNGRVNYIEDQQLCALSAQQKVLRQRMLGFRNTRGTRRGGNRSLRELRQQRTRIFNAMRDRMSFLRKQGLMSLCEELERTPDSRRQFAVHRLLRRKQIKAFELMDAEGYSTVSAPKLIDMVTKYYKVFFNPPHLRAVDPWGSTTGSLADPIMGDELMAAMARTNNGRAAGLDGLSGEFLKYGGPHLAEALASALNSMYTNSKYLNALGEGILIPLNKPGKPRQVNFLRPITLLTSLRKTFSLVILERIYPAVERFLPSSQCGFRRHRGSNEVAWAFGWLRATAHRYQRVLHIAGIDMSAAFDSMDREKLLHILTGIVPVTELRLVRSLLANTTLCVRIQGYLGEAFGTVLGTPQGDGLSPILFVIYLEGAMRELRATDGALYGKFNGHDWLKDISEMSYADDVDFTCPDLESLDTLMDIIPAIFLGHNLKVNVGKTERKVIPIRLAEPTTYKKLGSHTDADADVRLRIQKANLAFHTMWKTWNSRKVKFLTRRRLYNACIKPILLYNVAAAAYTESQMRKLESAHRRHLRHLLRIYWPKVVNNLDLYGRAGCSPLRMEVITARWRFFRTALLQPTVNPAASCMEQFYAKEATAPKVRGRPTTLPLVLHKDLMRVGTSQQLRTHRDLQTLRELARHCHQWQELTTMIVTKAIMKERSELRKQRDRRKRTVTDRARASAPREDRPTRRRLETGSRGLEGPSHISPAPVEPLSEQQPSAVAASVILTDNQPPSNARRRNLEAYPTQESSVAKRRRFRREQIENPGSFMRNSRRSSTALVFESSHIGRDI